MLNSEQNQTSSDLHNPGALDEFDKALQFLSDLPTDRAMKDLAKMKYCPEAVRKIVETMALSKMDFVKSLRLMNARENFYKLRLETLNAADKAMADWVAANPDYEIDLKAK